MNSMKVSASGRSAISH